jgi:hypothetical protein
VLNTNQSIILTNVQLKLALTPINQSINQSINHSHKNTAKVSFKNQSINQSIILTKILLKLALNTNQSIILTKRVYFHCEHATHKKLYKLEDKKDKKLHDLSKTSANQNCIISLNKH